jgi:hypothetical protein
MIKDWINRFWLTSLWATIALLTPLISFFFYVKVHEGELTVAIAFTVRLPSSRFSFLD